MTRTRYDCAAGLLDSEGCFNTVDLGWGPYWDPLWPYSTRTDSLLKLTPCLILTVLVTWLDVQHLLPSLSYSFSVSVLLHNLNNVICRNTAHTAVSSSTEQNILNVLRVPFLFHLKGIFTADPEWHSWEEDCSWLPWFQLELDQQTASPEKLGTTDIQPAAHRHGG